MLNEISTNINAIYNEIQEKLIPRNIRKGVTILNVDGTLEGMKEAYIVDTIVSSFTVTKPDSGSYTFNLNSNGYYESNNKGVQSSYALCKIQFNVVNDGSTITFDCICYGESGYDYGLFSQLDGTLTSSNTADSNAYFTFYGKASSSVQQVVYNNVSKGTHSIYIKYRKDGSVDSGNDTLQFKIITEDRVYKNMFIYSSESAMQNDLTQLDGSLATITDGSKLKNMYKYNANNEVWNLIQEIDYKANRYETTTLFRNDSDNYGSDFIGVIIQKNAQNPINIFRQGQIKIDNIDDEVYLDIPLLENESYHLSNVTGSDDDYMNNAVTIDLDFTKFKLVQYTPDGLEDPSMNNVLEYESIDGSSYYLSRSTFTDTIWIYNAVPNMIKGSWDSRIGQFLHTTGNRFDGLYYKTTATGSVNRFQTQLYANAEEIPNDNIVYGNNGVVTGTLYDAVRNGSNIGSKLMVYNKLKSILDETGVYDGKDIYISGYVGDSLPLTNFDGATSIYFDSNNIKTLTLNLGVIPGGININYDNTMKTADISFTSVGNLYISELYKLQSLKLSGEILDGTYPSLQNMYALKNIDFSNLIVNNPLTSMNSYFRYCYELVNFPALDTSSVTTFANAFRECRKMTAVPNYSFVSNMSLNYTFYNCYELVDASNTANQGPLTTISYGFRNCSKLENVPQWDLSHFTATSWSYCFGGCTSLTDESLNNILGSIATIPTNLTSNRTLQYLGLTQAQATKCTTLANWTSASNSGWTTGY